MGVNFRDIDGDGNGRINNADVTAFFKTVRRLFKENGAEDSADGLMSILHDTNPDRADNKVSKFFEKTGLPKYLVSDSTGLRISDLSYATFLWKELTRRSNTQNSAITLGTIVRTSDPQAYSWIDVSDGDKELVTSGEWEKFEKADANYNGLIEQSNILGGTNELEAHVKNITGDSDIFSADKQRSYKKRFGLWAKNADSQGNWQPKENLKISDFSNLWFQAENQTFGGVQSQWSFRRFYGYP